MVSRAEQMAIRIRMADGILHTLYVDGSSCTVSQLKLKISEELSIPAEFQKILNPASSTVENMENSDLIEKEHLTELSLVISLDDFCNVFKHGRGEELRLAFETAFKSRHLCKGNACIIKHMVACLQDDDETVRLAALEVLCQMGDKGDEHIVAALAACLEDQQVRQDDARQNVLNDARRLALSALPHFVSPQKGDEHLIKTVVRCLEYPDWNLRCQALSVLPHLTGRGHTSKHAISGVISCLKDAVSFVRCKALEVLSQITSIESGDEHINAVVACLKDQTEDVRCTALRVLPQCTKKGNAHVVAAVVESLKDQAWNIRCKALRAIPQLLDLGCPDSEKGEDYWSAVDAVGLCLEDQENDVRDAATDLLSQLTDI